MQMVSKIYVTITFSRFFSRLYETAFYTCLCAQGIYLWGDHDASVWKINMQKYFAWALTWFDANRWQLFMSQNSVEIVKVKSRKRLGVSKSSANPLLALQFFKLAKTRQ